MKKEISSKIIKIKVNNNRYFYNNSYKSLLLVKLCELLSKIIRFFSIFFFVAVYYLYYLSLEKCLAGEVKCSLNIKWIEKKVNEGIISAVILMILFEFIILRIISRIHLLHVILFFTTFFYASHGLEFHDHGLFNFLGVISFLIIGHLFFLPFNILFYVIKKRNNFILIIYIVFIIIVFILFEFYLNNFLSCNDWSKGLNNTYIENDIKYGCRIKIPKYCPYKFTGYFLDVTKRAGINCTKSTNTKRKILQFSKSNQINKKTKRIGYPLTNQVEFWKKKSNRQKKIPYIIREHLINMNNLRRKKKKKFYKNRFPEVIVDFSNNNRGKMRINLHFNKKLSMQRKKLEKYYNPYSNNIMILYFDSVSRVTGIRQLKKTLSFFERFMPYNSKDFHSFQFFKYHAFLHCTPGNYPKLFMDSYRIKSKNLRITYYLKQYGFVTAFSNDMCYYNPFPHKLKDFMKEGLCDHEFLICDPNRKHINSMFKRCLYGKKNIDYQYEYGNQFWRAYKNNRKFLMIVNNDGHEGTLEVIKYDDDTIYNFLNTLYKENLLKETTILLLADHGNPMPSVYYFNEFFLVERFLPMLFILSPDKLNLTYYQQYNNIHQNQQKFVTAYDIYNTICYLMLGNVYYKNNDKKTNYIFKSNLGINLFDPINSERSPKNYKNMNKKSCV